MVKYCLHARSENQEFVMKSKSFGMIECKNFKVHNEIIKLCNYLLVSDLIDFFDVLHLVL